MYTHQTFISFTTQVCLCCLQYTKHFSNFLILGFLTSCCSFPFVDCTTKVQELTVRPKVIEVKNNVVKNCIVKAWLLSSRDKKYDSSTVDLTVGFTYEPSSRLDTISPAKLFRRDKCYLEVGEEKVFVDPDEIRKSTVRKNYSSNSLQEIQYNFSFRVVEHFFKTNQKAVILNDLIFSDKNKIDIKVMLSDR